MSRRALPLILLAIVELGLLVALGWGDGFDLSRGGLVIFGIAFAAYAAAGFVVSRSGGQMGLIWVAAIGMRLTLLPLTPELSDDAYRYLWDGHVQLSGTNPYLYAPGAAEVAELRTPYHARINNPDVPTIYPPVAQVAFVLINLLGGSILAAKALWLAFDLTTGWLLARVAESTGRRADLTLLLYLWSPLLIVETAWSGHLEVLGLFALAAVLALERRPAGQGAALAAATLTKLAPIAALPALAVRGRTKLFAAFGAVAVMMYLPYLGAGPALFTGLRTYGEHWWFMQGAFTALEALFDDPMRARQIAGLLVAAAVVWTVKEKMPAERALLWTLGAGMVMTPTFHPWYVLWMLPMAALRCDRAWLLLSGLAFLGYFGLDEYAASGNWPQPIWLRTLLWLPFFVVLATDSWRSRGRQLQPEESGEEE